MTPIGFPYDEAMLTNTLANVRLLWDQGVTLAYGTDTSISPGDALRVETDTLARVFSPAEIVQMLTANAAEHVGLPDEIGTLAPGKAADLLLVSGDPLTDIGDLADVVAVIKGGDVVVDHR